MSFLKSFLSGEKSEQEKAILQQAEDARVRDVLRIDAPDVDEDDWAEEGEKTGCGTTGTQKSGGCGGCGCG